MVGYTFYMQSGLRDKTLVFSPTQMLQVLWSDYKQDFLESGTLRAMDTSRNNITTSEGQSYTMLRAVWMGDKETFDTAWQWTKDNLMLEDAFLFSWLFGERADGTYGVLEDAGGLASASDADQDIALALVFAYARWQDPNYLGEARSIIRDIWEHEVVVIGGTPYLAANNIEKTSRTTHALVNPSYLSPATYRIFALVDPEHPWTALADSSYALLAQSMDAPLTQAGSVGLPPDWILIDKQTARVSPPPTGTLTTNFSYDAMRVPWRVALDYQWFGTPQAEDLLKKMGFLSSEWRKKGMLNASYTHSGVPVYEYESPAMYGTAVGYFYVADRVLGQAIYADKLAFLFNQQTNAFKQELSYYDSNWAWFGIALWNELLPNLVADMPPEILRL
jgi:endo-1,4-beta-D-glucanase Y